MGLNVFWIPGWDKRMDKRLLKAKIIVLSSALFIPILYCGMCHTYIVCAWVGVRISKNTPKPLTKTKTKWLIQPRVWGEDELRAYQTPMVLMPHCFARMRERESLGIYEMLAWIIEMWMENLLESDNKCNVVMMFYLHLMSMTLHIRFTFSVVDTTQRFTFSVVDIAHMVYN